MENSSLRGRFSLSSTNLSTPIAESTCLNGAGSPARFNWGEGTISPRIRNNSLTTTKNASISKNVNGTPPKVPMSPISRIDPRTYVDIHSNGLASRIVKYHDNSARFNRSLSMGNLYNKPGQFPVVHLKKNEMQYKAKKCRNLSMTRIAAPEKSVFHGNTLSSILRSGSIVGLQKSDEEISRENRPILHPPPTENEMAPTRSVLEVLKEISRKRINSDELDGTELIKKHCKEPEFDTIPYNGQKTQSKRQREMSTSAASNSQISPEQQAVKKRMCNYNNDILSSLSSSNLSMNKKKILEMQSQKRTTELATSTDVDLSPARSEKKRCIGGNLDLEHIPQPVKSYTPITPLPSTPQQNTTSDELDKNRIGKVTRSASEPVVQTKPKLTLFNKDYDEVSTKLQNDIVESREDGDLRGIQFVKPKKSSSLSSDGTLLLEKTKKSKLALMLKGLKGELDEEDEVDALPNVPADKQVGLKTSVATTLIPSVSSTPAAISFGTTTTVSTAVTPTPNALSKSVVEASLTNTTSVVKSGIQFNPPASTASVSSSASNGFQIIPTAPVTSTLSAPAVVSTTSTSIPPIVTSVAPSIPSLGGFSFGLNKPLSLPVTTAAATAATTSLTLPQTTTVTSSSSAIVPATASDKIVGIKQLGFGMATTGTSPTTPSFTFGAPALSAPATQAQSFGIAPIVTATNSSAPPPVFGQAASASQPAFSFGSLAAINSTSTTTATPAVMTTSAPTFNFGTTKTSFSPAVTQSPANPILSIGSFDSAANSISKQTTTTTAMSSPAGGFSFSGTTSLGEPPKLTFGSIIPSSTAPANANATFSFSGNKPAVTTQANPTSAFTFGSQAAPITTSAQPSMFGSTTPIKPSNSFSFGAPAPATPTKGSFSFSSTTDKPVAPNQPLPSVGGFSFGNPAANNRLTNPEPNKNIFAAPAPADAAAKPVFSFGSASSTQAVNKTPMFGAPTANSTNLFGAPATTSAQSSPFAFGSSSNTLPNQLATTSAPSTNLFGGATTSNNLAASTTSAGSIFGAPSAAVAPQQQSSTFTFGASSSNTTAESSKPAAGGFVFGSSSAIGSNASKPATDMNKTFVFGDGNTTITPAPAGTTSLFGGSNATSSGNAATTENKMFSFGAAATASSGNNNTFGGSRQAVNQSPIFNFGAAASASSVPAQNGNSFTHQQQPTGATPPSTMMGTSDRPIRKAMRRLHKT